MEVFDLLKDDIPIAIKNAEKVCVNAFASSEIGKESPCYFNAYTNVHELFIDMKNFLDKKPSIRLLAGVERKKQIIDMIQFYEGT